MLGSAQLNTAGVASIKLALAIGLHSIKANFVGTTAASASSSSAVNVSVTGKSLTNTSITSSGTVGNYTLSAAVTSFGSGPPTGKVSFLDSQNVASIGQATLGAATSGMGFNQLLLPGAGSEPIPLSVGDFNGDGIPDIAKANINSNSSGAYTVTIFLSTGPGTFGSPYSIDLANNTTGPTALTVGDFKNDGKIDLAVASSPNVLNIFLGDGHGGFSLLGQTPAAGQSPSALATGDFNRDGNLDVAVVDQSTNNITILLGNGQGGFSQAAGTQPATGNNPYAVVAGGFNRDGKLDLAVANNYSNSVNILLGNGDGTFTAGGAFGTDVFPDAIAVDDFNGDGKQDLAVTNQISHTVTILLGDGTGAFATPPVSGYTAPTTGKNPTAVAIGDLNGDGTADLVIAGSGTQQAIILFGKGNGTFSAGATVPTGTSIGLLAVADANANGRPDVVLSDSGSNAVTVALNQATMTATASLANVLIPGSGTQTVIAQCIGDTNHAISTANSIVLVGTPLSATTTLTVQPSTTPTLGQTVQLIATIKPTTPGSVSVDGHFIAFFDGTTVLGIVTDFNGVAELDFKPTSAGAHNLSALFEGDGTFYPPSRSAAVTLTVGQRAPSTTTLTVPSNTVARGIPVTLSAAVTSNGKPVTHG